MFKNHLLQVSNTNNINKSLSISPSNSVFTTVFKKPINIAIGDIITLNSAFLDLRQASNNNIYLQDNVPLSFQFYYYHCPMREEGIDYNNNNTSGFQWGFDSSLDYKGQPYILCVSKRNYYENGEKRINPITGKAYLDEYNDNVFTNFYTTDGTDAPYFAPEVISPQSVNNDNRQAFCNQYTPYIGTYNMTLPAGSYTPSQIAEYITSYINKQIAYSQKNTSLTYYKSFLETYAPGQFTKEQFIFSTNPFIFNLFQIMEQEIYYYYVTGSASNPPNKLTLFIFQNIYGFDFFRPTNYMYAGSQNMALLYNDQGGSSSYSLLNHTAIFNNGSLSIMYRGAIIPTPLPKSIGCYLFTKVGGVGFKSLSPSNFWYDILGFTDDILMNIDNNNNTTESNYKASTSDTFASLSQIIYQSTYTNNEVNQNEPSNTDLFFVSQNFVEITAKNQYQQQGTSGHLLIESTAYDTDLQDDTSSFQIKNIVSSYYLSQGQFLAGSQLGSITYQHIGDDFPLSSITVRILDPETKQPIPTGIKNTVYFEIQKNIVIEQDKQNKTIKHNIDGSQEITEK